jgi:hypothetical protein
VRASPGAPAPRGHACTRTAHRGSHAPARTVRPLKKARARLLNSVFFLCTVFNTASCPSDSTVSEDAAIEPRAVATLALAVRRSNH